MIDTHTHLYLTEFADGGVEAVRKALSSGVNHLVFPNVDETTIEAMTVLHNLFPHTTSMAMGLHPTEVGDDWEIITDRIEQRISGKNYVAVGEVGIDLYWDKSKAELQKKAFRRQIEIAQKYALPVIIHCREALPEVSDIIREKKPDIPLIFHSFTCSYEDVKALRAICNPYFGINGVVTYKNAQTLRNALHEIGIAHMILETDSPYLTPVPYRGKRNESSYLYLIRDKIAETIGIPPEEVEATTDMNARNIFGL